MRVSVDMLMRAIGIAVLAAHMTSATGYSQGQASSGSQAAAFTIDGDAALWTVAIRPDKTQDFERVMTKLRDALHNLRNRNDSDRRRDGSC